MQARIFLFLFQKLVTLEKNTDLLQSWKQQKPLRCRAKRE